MTLDNGPSRSLAEVVGANCRDIRKQVGLTQDALAVYARAYGLKWNAAKVANFEAGRWEATLATVLALGMVLEHVLTSMRIVTPALRDRAPITLADLLDGGDGFVALNDDVMLAADDLADVGRGQPFPLQYFEDRMLQRSGLAEQRLAKSLGVSSSRLADLSSQLWGKTFSEERDHRAGPDGNQQKRGQISRQLKAEMLNAIEGKKGK